MRTELTSWLRDASPPFRHRRATAPPDFAAETHQSQLFDHALVCRSEPLSPPEVYPAVRTSKRRNRIQGDKKMKPIKTALLASAAIFALNTGAAIAEDAPGATSDITIVKNESDPGSSVSPSGDVKNEGALTAPEKDTMDGNETTGGMTDRSAANVPGADAEGDGSTDNQGSLSAPEKDAMGTDKPTGGMTDESAANVPGADAEGDDKIQNQGSLSAPEKDTGAM
jgi:hypothetical protein